MPPETGRDAALLVALRVSAALSGIIVVLIAAFLVAESIPALRVLGFGRWWSDASWHPAADASQGTFNLVPMVVGTVAASFGAILLAAPLGLLSALFGHGWAPPLVAGLHRRMIELLAGIPSVVYGFWGLVVLVPLIRRIEPPGASLLAGILILALMILPTAALGIDAALRAIPREQARAAAALGLSRRAALLRVALPTARRGVVTAVVLALTRALGETMAVLMVCGNIVRTPASLFDPVRTLTANIALEMAYALGDHRAALFVSGLLLLLMVTALIVVVDALDAGRLSGDLHG